jgi:hypothetical protein
MRIAAWKRESGSRICLQRNIKKFDMERGRLAGGLSLERAAANSL